MDGLPTEFQIPTYTGSHAIFGDAAKGYIELYDSGTLTFNPPRPVDLFVVGGGGGGSQPVNSGMGGGAGAGGYTHTEIGKTISSVSVLIGAGAPPNNTRNPVTNSGSTQITDSIDVICKADGGSSGYNLYAGIGGSGGGGGGSGGDFSPTYGETGSSNGERAGVTGQGTTTVPFADAGFEKHDPLAAGGGGGGTRGTARGGKGGEIGGGNGYGYITAGIPPTSGTENTGGGGGGGSYGSIGGASGGSGIAIIRWGY